jgi:hypothetical protein
MCHHHNNPELVASCLRSLYYITEAEFLVHKLVTELDFAKKLLYVMRSCDYDEDVTAKGLQVIAQVLQVKIAREEVRTLCAVAVVVAVRRCDVVL